MSKKLLKLKYRTLKEKVLKEQDYCFSCSKISALREVFIAGIAVLQCQHCGYFIAAYSVEQDIDGL